MQSPSLDSKSSDSVDTKVEDGFLTLFLSVNSVHNATISGHGYTYEVTSPSEWGRGPHITSVFRHGGSTKELVGEIHWRYIRSTTVRMGGEKASQPWLPIKEFLRRDGGSILSSARTFTGAHGQLYRWQMRRNHLVMGHDADRDSSETPPLAKFKRPKRNMLLQQKRQACLLVSPQLADTLDSVIVSFLVMEKKRRDNEKAVAAAAAGGS